MTYDDLRIAYALNTLREELLDFFDQLEERSIAMISLGDLRRNSQRTTGSKILGFYLPEGSEYVARNKRITDCHRKITKAVVDALSEAVTGLENDLNEMGVQKLKTATEVDDE